jgi:hypothetical protein
MIFRRKKSALSIRPADFETSVSQKKSNGGLYLGLGRTNCKFFIAHYALNGQMRSKAHTALTAPLVLHPTRIYKCAMKKFVINGQFRNEIFYIVISRFSLERAAMNALRICKMCNGVSKTPSFSSFFNCPSAQ